MTMKKYLFMALLALWTSCMQGQDNTFWLGADISGTTEMESHGVQL